MKPAKKDFVTIAGRCIGVSHPPYIVAEMSGNHNQHLSRALALIDAAKAAGADAVKIQTYRPDTITIDSNNEEFIVRGGLWDGRRLFELYQEAHTPWEWHAPMVKHAKNLGIPIFSSPFDHTAVDFLEELDIPAYKIASPELIDLPLIRKVACTGKPVILSTGAATLREIEDAVNAARGAGCDELVLLHCTAAYPAPPEEANLTTIPELARRFGAVAGLSDHTLGTSVATAAVALGAHVIEKHFTLSRGEGGVDSAFSLEPAEFARLVDDARIAAAAIGLPTWAPTRSEASVYKNRRSLYVVAPVAKGELFTHHNVRSIRPGVGLPPRHIDTVIGRCATRDLEFGEPFTEDMVEGGIA